MSNIFLFLALLSSLGFSKTILFRNQPMEVSIFNEEECRREKQFQCYIDIKKDFFYEDNLLRIKLKAGDMIFLQQTDFKWISPYYSEDIGPLFRIHQGVEVWQQGRFIPSDGLFTEKDQKLIRTNFETSVFLDLPDQRRLLVDGLGYTDNEEAFQYDFTYRRSFGYKYCSPMIFQNEKVCVKELFFEGNKVNKISFGEIEKNKKFKCIEENTYYSPAKKEILELNEDELIINKECSTF